MEALVQNCLRRALQGSRSVTTHSAAQRTAAKCRPHAAVIASPFYCEENLLSGSTAIASAQSLPPPKDQIVVPLAGHTTLSNGKSAGRTVFDLIAHGGQQTMSQATGSGGRNGSYQNWLAAGAFPVAVAAYSGVALAKEKAPLALPGEVVLYQYEACPFCNKVKAFLDYHDISYKVVEVNPIGKKELKWSEYKKVPVLVVDGEPLNDSTNIISLLDERIYGKDKKPVASNTEEEKWRSWVDDYFVHLLSPNIYRTPSEALEAFDYITTNGNFTAWERAYAKYSGAIAMYFVGKRLKKKHNIEDERRDLFQAADKWVDAVGGRQFMGGEKPNLADLAVFGVLRPIRNMQTGRDLMANSKIGPWYARMEAEVGESNRLSDAPHV